MTVNDIPNTNQQLEKSGLDDLRQVGLELEEESQTRSDEDAPTSSDSKEAEHEWTRDPAEFGENAISNTVLTTIRSEVSIRSAASYCPEPVVSEDGSSSEYETQAKLHWKETVMLNRIAFSLVDEATAASGNC
jgi:hypothetical protein